MSFNMCLEESTVRNFCRKLMQIFTTTCEVLYDEIFLLLPKEIVSGFPSSPGGIQKVRYCDFMMTAMKYIKIRMLGLFN